MSGDVEKTCYNAEDARRWCATLNSEWKYIKSFQVVIWHGEHQTLYYIVEE